MSESTRLVGTDSIDVLAGKTSDELKLLCILAHEQCRYLEAAFRAVRDRERAARAKAKRESKESSSPE